MKIEPVPIEDGGPKMLAKKRWYEAISPISVLKYFRRKLKIGPKLIIGFSILIVLMLNIPNI